MALPKLNETVWYEIDIPSTNEVINYRPFLVKEQKQLLMAGETGDQSLIINSILDTIDVCIKEDISVRKLTSFDTDYIFSRIRGKSVGETSDIVINCKKCDHDNEIKVNIFESKIEGEMLDPIVKLTDQISVEMQYPTYAELFNKNLFDEEGNAKSAGAVDMIASCIKAVLTEEERIELKNESQKEVSDFIDSLNTEQFEKISQFVQNIPKLVYNNNFVCEKCSHENEVKLEGIGNFF